MGKCSWGIAASAEAGIIQSEGRLAARPGLTFDEFSVLRDVENWTGKPRQSALVCPPTGEQGRANIRRTRIYLGIHRATVEEG